MSRKQNSEENLCRLEKSLNGMKSATVVDAVADASSHSELALVGLQCEEEISDEEIFMGPLTDKEKVRSRKLRRQTQVFRPGFRQEQEEEEEDEDDIVERFADVRLRIRCDPDAGNCTEEDISFSTLPVHVQSPTVSSGSSSPGEEVASSSKLSCSDEGYDQPSRKTELKQGTASPQAVMADTSVTAEDVGMPVLSFVATSPQSRERDSEADEVELFSALDEACVLKRDADSTSDASQSETQTAMETSESVECNPSLPEREISQANDGHTVSPILLNEQNARKRSTEISMEATDICLDTPERRSCSKANTVIYSSPLLTTTNVQAVQFHQPLCFGNPVANEGRESFYGSRMSPAVGTSLAHSSFHPLHSAFTEPRSFEPVQGAWMPGQQQNGNPLVQPQVASQSVVHGLPTQQQAVFSQPGQTQVAGRTSLSSAYMYQSPVMSLGRFHSPTGIGGGGRPVIPTAIVSPNVAVMKENRPSHFADSPSQGKHAPVHDGMRSAPSPRILQVRTTQPTAESPSVARQRLIEEKRAMLARLRAEKEELRERIKHDNEKCFNMKMANATALHENMAEGMTPLLNRMPSQDCNGMASLTLDDHELDIVTKLHTIRNGQHAASSSSNSPCHHDRVPVRLHWNQDLILVVEQLSSPSRPRGVARPILSKKLHQMEDPSSSSLQPVNPRARQHLLF